MTCRALYGVMGTVKSRSNREDNSIIYYISTGYFTVAPERQEEIISTSSAPPYVDISSTHKEAVVGKLPADYSSVDINDNVSHKQRADDVNVSYDLELEISPTTSTHSAKLFTVVNNDITANTKYYSSLQVNKELSPQSPNSSEKSEMKFLLGVDKRVSSCVGAKANICEGDSTSLQRADVTLNIVQEPNSEKLERVEYYSPPKLEKELTPLNSLASVIEISPNELKSPSLERSELHMRIKGGSVGTSGSEASVDLRLSNVSCSSLEPLPAEEIVPVFSQSSEAAVTHDTVDSISLELPPPGDTQETASVSSGGLEVSRTQLTETEEMIETSVSNKYILLNADPVFS